MKDSFKKEIGNWDLEKIVRDCERKLKKAGIPIQNISEINIIRDRYLFGRIYTTYFDNYFVLDIANAYRNPKYELAEVQTVISHILLHTIKGCMNHGKKWREYAEKADKEYGLHIIAHEASRPKAGVNWESDMPNVKAVSNKGRCCFLDYREKLEDMVRVCSDELKKIGLNVGHVSDVLFRRDKDYGWCRKNDDDTFTILVSQKYAREDADLFGLKGLLCHELLHTCPDDNSDDADAHGPKWREMARKVEKEYGYKIMAQSNTDAIKQASDTPKQRYVCPICGGYYDVYNKDDDVGSDTLYCNWCDHKMNAIKIEDMEFLDVLYFMLGEYQDKMKIAGIPIGMISGVGFVSVDKSTGLHDNWDGSFSIDLPERFREQEMLNSDELKAYLCQELIRTCERCNDYGNKLGEYIQKAEKALGFSLVSLKGNVTEI